MAAPGQLCERGGGMSPVFSHGRLRLYLLKLLAEGPKHGYELIRLLENRFLGLYAPSAGTIYPRLQRMEAEGLVTHTAAGGRKTYEITEAGRQELARRADELAELEGEIHASVADLSVLAGEIEQQVSGSVKDIKKELRDATGQARSSSRSADRGRSESRAAWEEGRSQARAAWEEGRSQARAAWEEGRAAWEQGRSEAGAGWERGRAAWRAATGAEASGPGEADGADDPTRDLEEAVQALAREASDRARQAGVSESDLRAATAVVVSALTELRRLLR
jgi:DNA-binding PadR family transcriptional regulator